MQTASPVDSGRSGRGGLDPLILHPQTSFCAFVPGVRERETGQGGLGPDLGRINLSGSDVPFPKQMERQHWPCGLPSCETS